MSFNFKIPSGAAGSVKGRVKNFGDSLEDLRQDPMAAYDGADMVWMFASTALVMLMVPGMGLFYSGVSSQRSALSMMWLSLMAVSVTGIGWYLWGYTIAFGSSPNPFWGGAGGLAFHDVHVAPIENHGVPTIPELLFALFHGAFASFTAALVSGAVINKFRIWHFLIFIFAWNALVYSPIARWGWSKNGWGSKLGVMDFAGGTPVHISAATTAAVYSIFFRWRGYFYGWRRPDHPTPEAGIEMGAMGAPGAPGANDPRFRPHSVLNIVLGTSLLWVGWMGFNGGSVLGVNMRTISVLISTNLAACSGGLSWCFVEYFTSRNRLEPPKRKFSVIAFCNGVVAGLVAITPAAGYVPFHTAIFFGVVGAISCNLAGAISRPLMDTHHIFAIHGIGGFTGMFWTGVFAEKDVSFLDGYSDNNKGAVNGNSKQIGYQLLDAIAGCAYAAIATFLILVVMEIGLWAIHRGRPKPIRPIHDSDNIVQEELL